MSNPGDAEPQVETTRAGTSGLGRAGATAVGCGGLFGLILVLTVGVSVFAGVIAAGLAADRLDGAGQGNGSAPEESTGCGVPSPGRSGGWDHMGRRDPDGIPPITGVLESTVSKAIEIVNAVERRRFRISEVMAAPPSPTMWGTGEHGMGRAIDVMVDSDDEGDAVADYAWIHRARLGTKWIVWNHRIRSTSPNHTGQWEPYRGTTNPHTDHNHIFFADVPYNPPTTENPDICTSGGSATPRTPAQTPIPPPTRKSARLVGRSGRRTQRKSGHSATRSLGSHAETTATHAVRRHGLDV